MRSETCTEILMEKVAFYEPSWDMPSWDMPNRVSTPNSVTGTRTINLDNGYDPDADWAKVWSEEDIRRRRPRRRTSGKAGGAVSKAVKNVLKHASAMRQAAQRGKRMAGYTPGTYTSKGNLPESSEAARATLAKGRESIERLLGNKK